MSNEEPIQASFYYETYLEGKIREMKEKGGLVTVSFEDEDGVYKTMKVHPDNIFIDENGSYLNISFFDNDR